MIGINDLQSVFGKVGAASGSRASDAVASRTTPGNLSGENTSLLADDQRVSVSSAAGALARISGQDDVRYEKVAQLRAAIQAGTYVVSSDEVAGKLINSMLGRS